MIETVVSVDLMVEEELKVKKNHLAPDTTVSIIYNDSINLIQTIQMVIYT